MRPDNKMVKNQQIYLPKISVLMCVYNEEEEWLRDSIESILNQTFSDFEFIIINDNAFRKSNDIILKEYQQSDERIILIKNEKNIGLTKSLNIGLDKAKGEFIARMDADDVSLPDRLKKQYGFMSSHPEYICCGSNAFVLKEGEMTDKIVIKPTGYKQISILLYYYSTMIHPSLFFRNRKVFRYDNSFRYAQDYDLLLLLSESGKLYNFKRPLIYYRFSQKQISKQKIKEQNFFANKIRLKAINRFFLKHSHNFESSLSVDVTENRIELVYKELFKSNKFDRKELSIVFLSLTIYFQRRSWRRAFRVLILQPFLRLSFKIRIKLLLSIIYNYEKEYLIGDNKEAQKENSIQTHL